MEGAMGSAPLQWRMLRLAGALPGAVSCPSLVFCGGKRVNLLYNGWLEPAASNYWAGLSSRATGGQELVNR